MKTKSFKPFLTLAIAVCTFSGAYGQDQYLESDPINVDGYVKEARVSDHELETVKNELVKQQNAIVINKEKAKTYQKLGKSTEKLADATEDLIEERKESQAVIDKYNKKIKCLMASNPGTDCDKYVKRRDKVEIRQAAPQVKTVIKKKNNFALMNDIRVVPYVGVNMIESPGGTQLESSAALGASVESDISESFSVGLGFMYSNIDARVNNFNGGFNGGFNNGFNNGFNQEINYKSYSFDLSGKYYLTKTNRLRPYVGAGIAYTRAVSRLAGNNNFNNFNNFNNGFGNNNDSELTTSHATAILKGGTEIILTENIGLNAELGFRRGLGGSFNTQRNSPNRFNNPNFQQLEQFDDNLAESNIFSINAGMIIKF